MKFSTFYPQATCHILSTSKVFHKQRRKFGTLRCAGFHQPWTLFCKYSNMLGLPKKMFTFLCHYSDVIISAVASQITGVSMVCSTIILAQIKENIKAPGHFVGGIHRWPVNCPHKRASNAENVSILWRHHAEATDVLASCSSMASGTDYIYIHIYMQHKQIIVFQREGHQLLVLYQCESMIMIALMIISIM